MRGDGAADMAVLDERTRRIREAIMRDITGEEGGAEGEGGFEDRGGQQSGSENVNFSKGEDSHRPREEDKEVEGTGKKEGTADGEMYEDPAGTSRVPNGEQVAPPYPHPHPLAPRPRPLSLQPTSTARLLSDAIRELDLRSGYSSSTSKLDLCMSLPMPLHVERSESWAMGGMMGGRGMTAVRSSV